MERITTIADLNLSILILAKKQAQESLELKELCKETFESIKPVNVIKSTFKNLVSAPDLKQDILNTSMSIAAGDVSKIMIIGSSSNPLKQFFGNFIQMGVTKIFADNSVWLKSMIALTISFISKQNFKSKIQLDSLVSHTEI
jgi:hypothetical protein